MTISDEPTVRMLRALCDASEIPLNSFSHSAVHLHENKNSNWPLWFQITVEYWASFMLDIEARDPYSEEEIFEGLAHSKILGGLIGTLLQFSYGVQMKVSDRLPCLSSSKRPLIMPRKQLIGQSNTK